MAYSQQEMVDMVFCFGESKNNAAASARLYQRKYPTRRHPVSKVLKHIVCRFNETGSVRHRPRSGRSRTANKDNNSLLVLAAVHTNPHASSRTIAIDIGHCHKSVLNILHKHKFHPFHVHCVQHLQDSDFVRRSDFCNWLLCQVDENPNFISKIMWSDESQFTRDGIVNTHKSLENVHILHHAEICNFLSPLPPLSRFITKLRTPPLPPICHVTLLHTRAQNLYSSQLP